MDGNFSISDDLNEMYPDKVHSPNMDNSIYLGSKSSFSSLFTNDVTFLLFKFENFIHISLPNINFIDCSKDITFNPRP